MRKGLIAVSLLTASLVGAGALTWQMNGGVAHAASKHPAAAKKTTPKKSGPKAGTSTPHADGTVTAITGNTITVKADNDPAGSTEYTKVTTIVLVPGTTKYNAGHGATTTTAPTIAVGDYIVAEGTVSGTTLTATLVSVGHGGSGHGGPGHGGPGAGTPHADGTITNVNGTTLTVKADNDPAGSNEYTKVTTIVLVPGTTTYDAGKGQTTTTQPTITSGEYIVAEGTLSNGDTTLTATHVSVGNKGGH